MNHDHEWEIDYSVAALDSFPEHHALRCDCGAVACGNPFEKEIHDVKEPTKDPEGWRSNVIGIDSDANPSGESGAR